MTQERTFFRQQPKPKKSTVYLAPTPISKYKKDLDDTGDMLTFMAPIPGTIGNCSLFIGELDDDATAVINVASGGASNTTEIPVQKGINTIDTDFNVLQHDRISVSIKTTPSEGTKDFWLCFTFTPDHKFAKSYSNGTL
jgi:hypothetical protein